MIAAMCEGANNRSDSPEGPTEGPDTAHAVDAHPSDAGPRHSAPATEPPKPETWAGTDAVSPTTTASPTDDNPDDPPEPTPEITTESVVEALLFATDSPLPASRIAQILGVGDARSAKKHIAALNTRYEQDGASFHVEELAGGFQMLTLPAYNNWVSKLHSVRRESRLSPAALETLAVVAYKQPVLRADIESVRGVAVGDVLNRLREMGLVKIVGRAEVVGRPMLYGTTRKFLQVFGLASLEDLPTVDALALPAQQEPAAEPGADSQPQQEPQT